MMQTQWKSFDSVKLIVICTLWLWNYVTIGKEEEKFKNIWKLEMLSPSLFIQGFLWMLRLLFWFWVQLVPSILFTSFQQSAWTATDSLFISTVRCSKRTRLLSRIQSIHPIQLIAFEQSKQFRTYQDSAGT